jgi:hypothetical protein
LGYETDSKKITITINGRFESCEGILGVAMARGKVVAGNQSSGLAAEKSCGF